MRNYTDDLPVLIEWVRNEDLTVRLFDLMWHPDQDRYYVKYLISWQELLPIWEDRIDQLVVQRYPISGRIRVLFKLQKSGNIEVNLMQPKYSADAAICQTCKLAKICAEGYLGCGIRITPDLRLSPCILREELSTELLSYTQTNRFRDHSHPIDEVLLGL